MRGSHACFRLDKLRRLSNVFPIFVPGGAAAATVDWVGHDVLKPPVPVHTYNGTFSDAFNWSTRVAPGAGDIAQFNAAQSYTVTFTNSPTNAGLSVAAGDVTLASSLSPTYTVGTAGVSGQLTLSGVNLLAKGSLAVDGDGSLTVGAGTMLSGGDLSIGATRLPLGNQSSALTVSGSGANVAQLGAAMLTIGTSNPSPSIGLLHVDNGGAFTTGTGAIAVSQLGTINLTGGAFTAQGNLTIDGGVFQADSASRFNLSPGRPLTVQNGGRVDLSSSTDLPLAGATVLVDGAASHFNLASNLYVGSAGQASTATWQNNATGAIGGLIIGGTANPNTNGTVVIQSGGSVNSPVTSIGAANQSGQSGAVFLFGGGVLTAGQLSVGAALSSGSININGGTLIAPNTVAVGPKGSVAVNTGGTFDVHGNLSINGGSLTGSNGSIQLNPGSSLAVSNGATVQTAGTVWSIHGAPITVDNSQFNVHTPLTLGAGSTDSLTLNNADANLGDLHLADGQVPGTATVQVSGNFSAGNLFICTGGLAGQAATVTLSSGGDVNKIQIGAAANSTGALNIGGFLLSRGTTIHATGLLNLTTGALDDELIGLTVNGGAGRSDAGADLQLGYTAGAGPVTIQNGGTVDLNGTLNTAGGPILVDGSGSHLNVATAVTLNGPLTFQNGATGFLSGGLVLKQIDVPAPPITAVATTVASGARVTVQNVTLAYNTKSSMGSQLLVTDANSSLMQTAGGTLSVERGSTLSVQNGGTFIGGGTALVDAGGTIQVRGGTYRANTDMTFNGSLQQDAAGTFVLAAGTTIAFQTGATADIDGSFTGGNIINDGSLNLNGGNTSLQSLDGIGMTKVGAGAHLTADHIRQHALTVSGTAAVRAEPVPNLDVSASGVDSLTVTASGQLDLSNNRLQINYLAGQSPVLTIRGELATGYNNGAWNGPGIITSSGDATHALGYADSADGIVKNLPANTEVVQFARVGDADLDNKVDFNDLVTVARHYNQSNANWDQGDFNYDGKVGFDDLVAVARNYGGTLSAAQLATFDPSVRSDIEAAFAELPEPSAAAALVIPGAGLLVRRRPRTPFPILGCRRRRPGTEAV